MIMSDEERDIDIESDVRNQLSQQIATTTVSLNKTIIIIVINDTLYCSFSHS